MLTRLLASGLLAGVLSGLAVAALQHVTTTPLILKAETYEGMPAPSASHPQKSSFRTFNGVPVILAHADHAQGATAEAEEWAPSDGLERTAATSVATIATGVGFAFMLLSVMLVSNATITPASGLLWGAAAFAATGLAPGLGLSPELPGSAAGDLVARQIWWIATAAATAAGLWLALVKPAAWKLAAAAVLIVLPHLIGAPHAHEYTSAVPAEIASHFTSTSLVVHAVLWALVGALAGFFWQRQEVRQTA